MGYFILSLCFCTIESLFSRSTTSIAIACKLQFPFTTPTMGCSASSSTKGLEKQASTLERLDSDNSIYGEGFVPGSKPFEDSTESTPELTESTPEKFVPSKHRNPGPADDIVSVGNGDYEDALDNDSKLEWI